MNIAPQRALVAAAVVIVGSLAIGCQPSGSGVSGPSGSAQPPASAAQPPPSAAQAPASTPADYAKQPGGGKELAPGSYVFTSAPPLRVTITLPSGWYKGRIDWAVFENDSLVSMHIAAPDNIYADPCALTLGLRNPAVGPTVADLVTALAATPGLAASPASDVTVGGHTGQRIELTAPESRDECNDEPKLYDVSDGVGPPAPVPGELVQLWILDAKGTRLVIGTRIQPGANAEALSELQAIVDSIQVD